MDRLDCWAVDGIETRVVSADTDSGAARVSHHLLRLTLYSGRPKHRVTLLASPDGDAIAGWLRAIVACGAVPPTARALGSVAALRLAAQQVRERAALAPTGTPAEASPYTSPAEIAHLEGMSSAATLPPSEGITPRVVESDHWVPITDVTRGSRLQGVAPVRHVASTESRPAHLPKVLRCGWLLKKRDHLSGRNRRWFVLYAGAPVATAACGGGGSSGVGCDGTVVGASAETIAGASLVYFSSLSDDSPRGVLHLSSVSVSLLKAADAPSGMALALKPLRGGKTINLASEAGTDDTAGWLEALARHTTNAGTAAAGRLTSALPFCSGAPTAIGSLMAGAVGALPDESRALSATTPQSANGPGVFTAAGGALAAESPPPLDGALVARLWLEEAALSSLIDGVASRALHALVRPAGAALRMLEIDPGEARPGAGAARPGIDGGEVSLGPEAAEAKPRMETDEGAPGRGAVEGSTGEGGAGLAAARDCDGAPAVEATRDGVMAVAYVEMSGAGPGIESGGVDVCARVEVAASFDASRAESGDEATPTYGGAAVVAPAEASVAAPDGSSAACAAALRVASDTATPGAHHWQDGASGAGVAGGRGAVRTAAQVFAVLDASDSRPQPRAAAGAAPLSLPASAAAYLDRLRACVLDAPPLAVDAGNAVRSATQAVQNLIALLSSHGLQVRAT